MQTKRAQQGKQMRVGARKGFAYHSVKLVLLANGNRYVFDYNTFFLVVKPSIRLKYCPVLTPTFFWHTSVSVVGLKTYVVAPSHQDYPLTFLPTFFFLNPLHS